jgi:hypothetical protein
MGDDKENIYQTQRGPKRKALKPSLDFSSPDPCAVPSNDVDLKSEKAANIEARLKLEQLVTNLSEEVKKKGQEMRDLQKKIVPFNISVESGDANEQFKRGIER